MATELWLTSLLAGATPNATGASQAMNTSWQHSKQIGLAVITLVYGLAIGAGVGVFCATPDLHFFARLLLADVGATVLVFLASLAFSNASLYDPYWSVAPIVICVGTALGQDRVSPAGWLMLAAICFWGVRLTANWAYTFTDLSTQDWRYDHFKARYPRLFPLISFGGIMLIPTLVVYLCLLPAVQVLLEPSRVGGLTVIGFAVCLLAATLQLVADRQMHRFRRAKAGKQALIRVGLWRYARHPNYLGEILMWWGVFTTVLAQGWDWWHLGAGALANTMLFLLISIPMADRRNRAMRPGFEQYYRQTNSLLPIKVKQSTHDRL